MTVKIHLSHYRQVEAEYQKKVANFATFIKKADLTNIDDIKSIEFGASYIRQDSERLDYLWNLLSDNQIKKYKETK